MEYDLPWDNKPLNSKKKKKKKKKQTPPTKKREKEKKKKEAMAEPQNPVINALSPDTAPPKT